MTSWLMRPLVYLLIVASCFWECKGGYYVFIYLSFFHTVSIWLDFCDSPLLFYFFFCVLLSVANSPFLVLSPSPFLQPFSHSFSLSLPHNTHTHCCLPVCSDPVSTHTFKHTQTHTYSSWSPFPAKCQGNAVLMPAIRFSQHSKSGRLCVCI